MPYIQLMGKFICLLEIDPKILIEEAHHVNVFRGNYMKSSVQDYCMETLKRNEMGVEPIIKNYIEKYYSEPRERKSELEDCECEAQTINHQSNVIMTRPVAETEVSNKNTYDGQWRYDESIICSVDGTICFPLETNPKILIE
jgi:hypothetical protein